jgi:hypothetical protein
MRRPASEVTRKAKRFKVAASIRKADSTAEVFPGGPHPSTNMVLRRSSPEARGKARREVSEYDTDAGVFRKM